MSDAAAPAAAPAAAGPSNIDDPLEREKWIEEAIENDPVLVRRCSPHGGGGRAAPCWRPACLSGDAVEASVRIHHAGWHTFAPSSRLVDDAYALEWVRARGFPLR